MSHRILDGVTRRAPGRVAALLDEIHPNLPATYGPLNGQTARMSLVRSIFAAVRFDQVIETGTYRAETTQFLAALTDAPVYTAELLTRFHQYSKKRTRGYSNISLFHGDSRQLLQARSHAAPKHKTFLYLDAHWEADVPRKTELEIVRDTWNSAVVMIDDFVVPDDNGYGAANYSGRVLDQSYLPTMPGWTLHYPSTLSSLDSGARRGCAVLASATLAGTVSVLSGLTPGQVLS